MCRLMLLAAIAIALPAIIRAAEPSADSKLLVENGGKARFHQFVQSHCLVCHQRTEKSGGIALDELLDDKLEANLSDWERVVRKLAARQMPPKDAVRPSEAEFEAAIAWLTSSLDACAAANLNPGRTETFRRLTRIEYRNTIRDLLALDIDVAALLPPDEATHGFDTIGNGELSASSLSRYVAAAQKISRLALGAAPSAPNEDTFRVRPDVTQDVHLEGLPLGTRGGILIPYQFPCDGQYEIQVRLMRDRNEGIESLNEPHDLEVSLDRERVELFVVKPSAKGQNDPLLDDQLKTRITTQAGSREVAVAFLKKPSSLLETKRQPLNVHYNFYRHPRLGPAVYQVSIIGPLDATATLEVARPADTPSRRRWLVRTPADSSDEESCAREILADLSRRAFRRPVTDDDLAASSALFQKGRAAGGFEAGIELALASILTNPQFLFHIERDPPDASSDSVYRISNFELASRLSYFLWSSMPDDGLFDAAASGMLSQTDEVARQARRMLSDDRSNSLVTNFAAQWLYLRNLESVIPDMRLFPDFDDNLRQAMRRETELFVAEIVGEDRSVLDLIKADHTFLNGRLAKHYGIAHVHGSRFRRVALDASSQRGGLLRNASILAVTSYPTRTSPVIRGQWVLKNLLGTPPPPQPPDVPALADNTVSEALPVRERLRQHRANTACASCHEFMDPTGFALDNFDAIGRWRETDAEQPIDATGGLPGGSEFVGVAGLEAALLDRPELFVQTLVEKLMAYGLGRNIGPTDAPAIRKIVADARTENYRFSDLVVGIVSSPAFQMRRTQ